MKDNEKKVGAIQAGLSYAMWGVLPIYWKALEHVNAGEILASRVLWSFALMIVLLLLMNKWNMFLSTIKEFGKHQKEMWALIVASILISSNWFIFIWAVNHEHILQVSLGYYINPLVSVLLGVFFLRERLSVVQYISFFIALFGVIILTFSYGQFPWVSIMLALTFAVYGLVKKLIKVDSAVGLTLETMAVTPIALGYLIYLFIDGNLSFIAVSVSTDLLLIGTGLASAVPLLFFANGAQKIPLSMLGYLQYLAPTLMLIIGIFVYGEHFSSTHLLSFTFIWIALLMYTVTQTRIFVHIESKWKKRKGLEV